MEFEYTDAIYVDSSDLRRMYLLCKNEGATPKEAIDIVTSEWDDYPYYEVYHITDQLIEEINRRLAQSSK